MMLLLFFLIGVMLVYFIAITFSIDSKKDKNVNPVQEHYNVQEKAKIVVPDAVDASESTIVSTQKEECKVYEVKPTKTIEKIVIESNKKEKNEAEDPIKENNGFLSNIFKNNN